jgi:hypothetical protein
MTGKKMFNLVAQQSLGGHFFLVGANEQYKPIGRINVEYRRVQQGEVLVSRRSLSADS